MKRKVVPVSRFNLNPSHYFNTLIGEEETLFISIRGEITHQIKIVLPKSGEDNFELPEGTTDSRSIPQGGDNDNGRN